MPVGSTTLFGNPSTEEAVRVGYIDPERGYVTGLSICEANEYAQRNPGTTFVAVDGNNEINYLNINQVNNLTVDFARRTRGCDGLRATVSCGQPVLTISGGGGIGAQGNIIVGTDGSVMGVDLVHRGYGYQYPPLARAIDECYFGNGARFEVLLGTSTESQQVFDREQDFEEYFNCPPGTGYGRIYDEDGNVIGDWDPSLYTNPGEDPIRREIQIFERLINSVQNPWWTTRTRRPTRILGGDRNTQRTVTPVSHPCRTVDITGEPVSRETVEIEEVTFTLNPDGGSVNTPTIISFTSNDRDVESFVLQPTSNNRNTTIRRRIRKNVTYQVSVTRVSPRYGSVRNFERVTDRRILIDYNNSNNDRNDLFLSSNLGTFTVNSRTRTGEFILRSSTQRPNRNPSNSPRVGVATTATTWNDFMNQYAVSPVPPSNTSGSDFAGTQFTLEWDETFPYTGDYIFRGCKDGEGRLFIDNELIGEIQNFNENPNPITRRVTGGNHTIRVDLLNQAVINSRRTVGVTADRVEVDFSVFGSTARDRDTRDLAFAFVSEDGQHSFTIRGPVQNRGTRNDRIRIRPNTVYRVTAVERSETFAFVEQGILVNGRRNREGGLGTSNRIFADYVGSGNDNNDIQITAGRGIFTSSNRRRVRNNRGSTRNTYDLTFFLELDETTRNALSAEQSASLQSQTIFDTASQIDRATTSLFRASNINGTDSDFFNRYAVSPVRAIPRENPNDAQTFEISAVNIGDSISTGNNTNTFEGNYRFEWRNIEFPRDGDYEIEVMADDSARVFIGNRTISRNSEVDRGLRSTLEGGDETIIEHTGFSSPGVRNARTRETRFFRRGVYRIRVQLSQSGGDGFLEGNIMGVAINITTRSRVENIISRLSWCDNPMGVALTIEAPPVPIPQETAPVQEGDCPPTPFWSSRLPASTSRWYPVRYNGAEVSSIRPPSALTTEYVNIPFNVVGEHPQMQYLRFVFTSVDGLERFTISPGDIQRRTYNINRRVRTGVRYRVTADITNEARAGFTEVEQGLVSLRRSGGDNVELTRSTRTGRSIFADYIGSPNDNDDIRLTVDRGDGEFSIGRRSIIGENRTTYELFYELESRGNNRVVSRRITPRFIRQNDRLYLDMREFVGPFELEFRFMVADTRAGDGGLAATAFEIPGTSIRFDRRPTRNRLITDDRDIRRTFTVDGGRLYGPVRFLGGTEGVPGVPPRLISANQVASYDPGSIERNARRGGRADDPIDFNVVILSANPGTRRIEGWSEFLNRYAISPIPPLRTRGTDGGGQRYTNSWNVDFPYSGFYKFEGEVDNVGSVYLDNTQILDLDRSTGRPRADNRRFVSRGVHNIRLEVENERTEVTEETNRRIFTTQDWQNPTRTTTTNLRGSIVAHAGGGRGGVSANTSPTRNGGRVIEGTGAGNRGGSAEDTRGGGAGMVSAISPEGNAGVSNTGANGVTEDGTPSRALRGFSYGGNGAARRGPRAGRGTNGGNGFVRLVFITGTTRRERTITALGQREIEAPAGTTQIYAYCYGGGGSGYRNNDDVNEDGFGGGGGAFASGIADVDPTTRVRLRVGVGRGGRIPTEGSGSGDGGDSYVVIASGSSTLGEPTTTLNGVTYEGPDTFAYRYSRWSEFMNTASVSPETRITSGNVTLTWRNVNFPETGQYQYRIQADNLAIFSLDGQEIARTTDASSPEVGYRDFNVTAGNHTITIELTNTGSNSPNETFDTNPCGVALYINRRTVRTSLVGRSWYENPIGIGVAVIAPPCPRQVSGIGIVESIIPTNPGTGYVSSSSNAGSSSQVYNAILALDTINVVNSGINYNCGADPITITPSNGAVLSYSCDSFGRISTVNVVSPGIGFTATPTISIASSTGINFEARPVFRVIRDPIITPDLEANVIQVTDLVGLKQTGWYEGREYYGAVFYRDGLRYAGYYETVGELVRIYDTRQESIDAIVTTPASAIQRSGTDVTNNDPRLDIPGTPGSIVEE